MSRPFDWDRVPRRRLNVEVEHDLATRFARLWTHLCNSLTKI